MKELNSFEVEEVNGGILFIALAFTPQIAAGVAAGAVALGGTAVGTFIGLRYVFNEM